MQSVVIVGAGGFGREVLDIFEAANEKNPSWDVLGFIDDNPKSWGLKIRNNSILGGTEWFSRPEGRKAKAVVAIGDNPIRRRVVQKAIASGAAFCTIVHPSVMMTPHVSLGEDVIVAAGCIMTNEIEIRSHTIVNLDVTIGHDTIIEEYVNLNPGVHINGRNRIMEGAYIGTGAVTIQNVSIGKWSVVGAGAVVTKDIPDRVVAVGAPAEPIKSVS